jgi:hypothetical protein
MVNIKSCHWKVFYPGECYAWDLEYCEPVDEQYVRADVRIRECVKHLPAGTYVEPGSTNDWYNALSPEDKKEQDRMFATR